MMLGELCAGAGALGLALDHAAIGHTLAWFAEVDDDATAVMDHNHPGTTNLGDVTTITDPPAVDIVTAGFPCQPVSMAGQRKGVDDDRWLIDDVCRVARASGARLLILENVAGLLTANDGDALARTCAAMAREGYRRWEWGTVRASDIGAPHRRRRWFCVAHADSPGLQGPLAPIEDRRPGTTRRAVADPDGATLGPGPVELTGRQCAPEPVQHPPASTDPGSVGRGQGTGPSPSQPPGVGRDGSSDDRGTPVADPDDLGRQGVGGIPALDLDQQPGPDPDRCDRARFGGYAEAVARWEHLLGRPAPDPTTDSRLNPAFVEWMMGLPAGWVTDVAGLSRSARLRILGNSVVPQQAAAAVLALRSAA